MKSDFSISSGSVIASDLHATCPPSAALQALAGGCESARRPARHREASAEAGGGGRERSNLCYCNEIATSLRSSQ